MFPHLLRRLAAVAVLLGAAQSAVAEIAVPGSELPGRERERFVQRRAPLSPPGRRVISLPSTIAPAGAETLKVVVRAVTIEGGTVYSRADLAPLYADIIGREVAVSAIYEVAQRITTKYGNDESVIVRAIVPPQELTAGGATIRIQIIEGYIDRVE